MVDQKEIQENVMKMRYIEQQVQQLHQQTQGLERAMLEIAASINALKEIKNVEENASLIPIGAGVFVDATLKKQDTVLVDVGSQAVVEKSFDEAIVMLEQREKEVSTSMTNMQNMIRNLEAQYMESGAIVQELQK